MRSTRRPRTLAIGLIATGALLLGACGGPAATDDGGDSSAKTTGKIPSASSESLLAAAKKEGKVVWYSSNIRPNVDLIAKLFEKKYPDIEVETFQAGGSQVIAKVEAEIAGGGIQADFVDYSQGAVGLDQSKRGLLERFAPEHIDELADDLKDPNGYFFTPYFITTMISYNSDVVSKADAPKSWKDLTDPKWKGKVSFGSPDYAGSSVITIAAWDQEFGGKYVEELGANKLQVLKSFGDVQNSLLSGQAPIGVNLSFRAIAGANGDGPSQYVLPEEGQIKLVPAAAVVKGAEHPNAAKLFANFLLGDEVQEALAAADFFPARAKFGANIKGFADLDSMKFLVADPAKLADAKFVAEIKQQFKDAM